MEGNDDKMQRKKGTFHITSKVVDTFFDEPKWL